MQGLLLLLFGLISAAAWVLLMLKRCELSSVECQICSGYCSGNFDPPSPICRCWSLQGEKFLALWAEGHAKDGPAGAQGREVSNAGGERRGCCDECTLSR